MLLGFEVAATDNVNIIVCFTL